MEYSTNTKNEPSPNPRMYYGPLGEIVTRVSPQTEADPVAVFAQLLSMFGNCCGRNSYYLVGATKHYPVLFSLIVGRSSKARKGTAADLAKMIFRDAEPEWAKNCCDSGLSSGEGIINRIRDQQGEDAGVSDKRLFLLETEFGGALRVLQRDGNKLSSVVRDAWDGNILTSLIKHNRITATDPHMSIVGQIVQQELQRYLTNTEIFNGFGNRFLFIYSKRSKLLPHGGDIDASKFFLEIDAIKRAIEFGRKQQRLTMDDEGRKAWEEIYEELSVEKDGLVGVLTSRGEAQILRLSMILTLSVCSSVITADHLFAAYCLWQYCVQSCEYIFADFREDPDLLKFLTALEQAGKDGLTRTDISNLYGRNRGRGALEKILGSALVAGKATYEVIHAPPGRPKEVWYFKQPIVQATENTN
ncbi:MAG: hypothetical protein HYW48_08775 [Deltaproteobacteria bacterium]|nr:hypothetical protein [Deltaproteobacteria bacterium]